MTWYNHMCLLIWTGFSGELLFDCQFLKRYQNSIANYMYMFMISGRTVTHEWSHQNLWYDTPERISKKSRGNMDGLRFSPIIVVWKFTIVMFYAENFLKKVTFELMLLFFKTWLILILSYILYAFIQSFSITSYFYRIL